MNDSGGQGEGVSRRGFLRGAAGVVAAAGAMDAAAQEMSGNAVGVIPPAAEYVDLSQIHGATEAEEHAPGPFLPMRERVGYAVVGLGRLSINQILPAFAKSEYSRVTALVSGDRIKALKVAAQYGVPESNITDYANFEKLAQMPGVDAIYIVLPNSMHREFVVRGAKMRKHILCEKPMANTPAECEEMIAACKAANVKLMIAYRQQYDPLNRFVLMMVKSGKLGRIRSIVGSHSQNNAGKEGGPQQWRHNLKLAGGGSLPDVGLYCLNAARFLSGEEPDQVYGETTQPEDDPRFKEVEARCNFLLRFPSGISATLTSAYDTHRSTMLRLECEKGWIEMSPAFSYHGNKVRYRLLVGEGKEAKDTVFEPTLEDADQFALEMDHFSTCVRNNVVPHTPGEEGLQDQRLIEAIYRSAKQGKMQRTPAPKGPTRGPDLPDKI